MTRIWNFNESWMSGMRFIDIKVDFIPALDHKSTLVFTGNCHKTVANQSQRVIIKQCRCSERKCSHTNAI